MIYFDNNATTMMPPEVIREMLQWANRGNPSASYAAASESRKMMEDFRQAIGRACGISIVVDGASSNPESYRIIFTSGGSEANAMAMQGYVSRGWSAIRSGASSGGAGRHSTIPTSGFKMVYEQYEARPHIVVSSIEHKSILDCANSLRDRGLTDVTFVEPTSGGHILVESVAAAVTDHTCGIFVMHANNETGAINDVAAISEVGRARSIPFHTDAVQTFGKYPRELGVVDSFAVSFHKFHGPPGCGIFVIKNKWLSRDGDEAAFSPIVFGSQNDGWRGGTENLLGIGAGFRAMQLMLVDRQSKNARMAKYKMMIVDGLRKHYRVRSYQDYIDGGPSREVERLSSRALSCANELILISGVDEMYLPNTLLLSIVRCDGTFCNAQAKKMLDRAGIVISVGSACNTANPRASHVLFAMKADHLIRKGALRISIGDDTTADEVARFVRIFAKVVRECFDEKAIGDGAASRSSILESRARR